VGPRSALYNQDDLVELRTVGNKGRSYENALLQNCAFWRHC